MNRLPQLRPQSMCRPQHNHILAALSSEVQDRLFPYLELVSLPLRSVLYEAGDPIHHVYFPTDSVLALQCVMENGASTTVLIVGNEGLFGMSLLMGGESTPTRPVVQSAGYAYRLSHNRLTMTQEFISNMLGVRRESITQAAHKLQRSGVITYSRGMITVLDRPKLERLSCECYDVVKRESDLLLHYVQKPETIKRRNAPTAVARRVSPFTLSAIRKFHPSEQREKNRRPN